MLEFSPSFPSKIQSHPQPNHPNPNSIITLIKPLLLLKQKHNPTKQKLKNTINQSHVVAFQQQHQQKQKQKKSHPNNSSLRKNPQSFSGLLRRRSHNKFQGFRSLLSVLGMEVEVSGSNPSADAKLRRADSQKDKLRVKRKTLQAVLEQCQRALESLDTTGGADGDSDGDDNGEDEDDDDDNSSRGAVDDDERQQGRRSTSSRPDCEADELCNLLKSRVECPDFLEKLECAQASSVPQNMAEEGSSWDLVNENDLWEDEDSDLGEEDYVLVRQEDIVEGIACFMAAYLLSLKQTKELTPNQLQDALSKTFSVKKKKGKLRKAWDGSKVIYNVASWGATAMGIYQNPVIIRAATKAFWTSCQVISKLL